MKNRMLGAAPVQVLSIALIAAASTALLATQPVMAASSNACVTVRVDAPFRLPDGVLRPAGELTLCDTRSYSPVSQFHVVLVNGSTVGLFQSRMRSTEIGVVDAPEVVFERDLEGTLALVGYILPVAGRSVAFRLNGEGESWQAARRGRADGAAVAPVAAIIAATGTH